MNMTILDANHAARLRSYRQNYAAWTYGPKMQEIEGALVVPQTVQTPDHDLKAVFHHPLMIFNGGVYTAAGEIVGEAIHEGMLGLRHVPDAGDLAEPEHELEGTWLYGGFLFRHIGHMMTESVGRLWALRDIPEAAPCKGVVFIAMNGFPPADVPVAEWLKQSAGVTERSTQTHQMLEMFGVDVPVHLVGPATRVERLVVPSQLMGLLPYGNLMEGHARYREDVRARVAAFVRPDRWVEKRRVYVSRSRFLKPTSASIFGEAALDAYFAAHGYDVIHPETMSLRDQIERYASASHIVLAAGSASHVAALAMNGTQDVVLLKRFPGQKDQFGPQLQAMGASRVTTVDVIAGRFLPLDARDRQEFAEPAPAGMYAIDVPLLWRRLEELGFVDRPLEETMRDEVAAQVPVVAQALADRYGTVFALMPIDADGRPAQAPAVEETDIGSIVAGHAAFRGVEAADWRHVSIPKGDGMIRIEVDAEGVRRLEGLGIRIIGEFGDGNCVYLHPDMPRIDLQVALYRRHRNMLVLGRNTRLRGRLDMPSDENIFVAGSAHADVGISAMFRYHQGGLVLGEGGSSPVANYWVEGPGCSILVGDDFLFSWGIWLRTADSHALVDLASRSVINRPKSIVLESHVWLGQDVIVMPGGRVGRGAVVGARSVVTRGVPGCCVAVGSPARVVRRGASWTRSANPDAAAVDGLVGQMTDVAAVP